MEYILWVVLTLYSSDVPSQTTVFFATREACEDARVQFERRVLATYGGRAKVTASCIASGRTK